MGRVKTKKRKKEEENPLRNETGCFNSGHPIWKNKINLVFRYKTMDKGGAVTALAWKITSYITSIKALIFLF